MAATDVERCRDELNLRLDVGLWPLSRSPFRTPPVVQARGWGESGLKPESEAELLSACTTEPRRRSEAWTLKY